MMKPSILLLSIFAIFQISCANKKVQILDGEPLPNKGETTIGEKQAKANKDFSCTLVADKPTYKIGELPKFTVSITNNSKKDVYLIGSLDGSTMERRYPHCTFSIDFPEFKKKTLGICGNINTLKTSDFVKVKKGKALIHLRK